MESLRMTGKQLLFALRAVLKNRNWVDHALPRFSRDKRKTLAEQLGQGPASHSLDLLTWPEVGGLISLLSSSPDLLETELEAGPTLDTLFGILRLRLNIADDDVPRRIGQGVGARQSYILMNRDWGNEAFLGLLCTFFVAVASGEITEADLV